MAPNAPSLIRWMGKPTDEEARQATEIRQDRLIFPKLLNYLVAGYLIFVGLIQVFNIHI